MTISKISETSVPLPSSPLPAKSNREELKQVQNTAIMEAQLNVSIKSGDESLRLLYKTALDAINKELEPSLGPNAVQKNYDNNLDVSPEATAERIVKSATSFFSAFREQNTKLSDDEAISQFMDVIGEGINKGFEEARNILDALSVLEGEVASNIDLTYEFVQSGLKNFVEQFAKNEAPEATEAAEITPDLKTVNPDK